MAWVFQGLPRMPRDLSQVAQGDGQTSSQQTQPTTSSAAATKKPPTGAALAEECKQAPAPSAQSSLLRNPPQNRADIADLSRPVLIADASPAVAQAQQANCLPPRSALDAIREQGRIIREGQRRLTDDFNRLPTPPGG
jgi:hypothetical protein